MSPLLSILLALAALPAEDGVLELRLEGPLESVSLDGVRVPTRVLTELGPAESLTVRVPWLPVDSDTEPALRLIQGDGSARVESVQAAPGGAPSALARRPLPRPVQRPARISAVGWWLFIGGLLAVMAARRRPMGAAAIGALFSVILCALPLTTPARPVVAVLEVGSFGAWWVQVGRGSVEPMPSAELELETRPSGASWEWVVDARDPAVRSWVAQAGEATTLVARSPSSSEVSLNEAQNNFRPLEELWRRTAAGEWTWHGSWAEGASLPPAQEGGLLPTWLRSGASPGAEVWVGRLLEAPAGAQEAWVRVILPGKG